MQNYLDLMKKVFFEGEYRSGTYSLFGESLEFNLEEGFPLVTSRKINYQAAFGELAAFLAGSTDTRTFNMFGVNFWDADCSKASWVDNPNRKHEFDLGKIYGYQWVEGFGFNQIDKLIEDIKKKPFSRRHLLITYNPKDLKEMCLPPCYVSHQFYVDKRNRLHMMVHQRSADLCIGVPFDIASFALFQELMAKETGRKAGTLKINFGDVHIYEEHVGGVDIQLQRESTPLPTLRLASHVTIKDFKPHQAEILNYYPDEPIKYPFIVQQ